MAVDAKFPTHEQNTMATDKPRAQVPRSVVQRVDHWVT